MEGAARHGDDATIDRGPVMIYFGQEVGEPGAGNEGYQGDDGRTTIYDYWGVPEHQKWMSGGTFSGESVEPRTEATATDLRRHLESCARNPAISQGEYVDLTRVQSTGR